MNARKILDISKFLKVLFTLTIFFSLTMPAQLCKTEALFEEDEEYIVATDGQVDSMDDAFIKETYFHTEKHKPENADKADIRYYVLKKNADTKQGVIAHIIHTDNTGKTHPHTVKLKPDDSYLDWRTWRITPRGLGGHHAKTEVISPTITGELSSPHYTSTHTRTPGRIWGERKTTTWEKSSSRPSSRPKEGRPAFSAPTQKTSPKQEKSTIFSRLQERAIAKKPSEGVRAPKTKTPLKGKRYKKEDTEYIEERTE